MSLKMTLWNHITSKNFDAYTSEGTHVCSFVLDMPWLAPMLAYPEYVVKELQCNSHITESTRDHLPIETNSIAAYENIW